MMMGGVTETARRPHRILLTEQAPVTAVAQPHAQHRLLLDVVVVTVLGAVALRRHRRLLEALAGAVHHGAVSVGGGALHGEARDEVV